MRSSAPFWRSGLRASMGAIFAARMLAAAMLAAVLAGCAATSSSPSVGVPSGTAPTITGAWVRPPQGPDRPAGGYLVIAGGSTADALLSVASAAAGSVELHETTTDSSGMSGMDAVPRLEIPAGATVELKPGGYHLMLMNVANGAIEVGKTVTLELTFEKAGTVTVQAEVRAG